MRYSIAPYLLSLHEFPLKAAFPPQAALDAPNYTVKSVLARRSQCATPLPRISLLPFFPSASLPPTYDDRRSPRSRSSERATAFSTRLFTERDAVGRSARRSEPFVLGAGGAENFQPSALTAACIGFEGLPPRLKQLWPCALVGGSGATTASLHAPGSLPRGPQRSPSSGFPFPLGPGNCFACSLGLLLRWIQRLGVFGEVAGG